MFFTQLSPTVICRLHETIEVFLSESGTDPISGSIVMATPTSRWMVTGKYDWNGW